jgi:hypothetical protein
MRIRPATHADAAAIAAIVAECDGLNVASDYELRKAREAVTSSTRRTVLAEIRGTPVGYAHVTGTSRHHELGLELTEYRRTPEPRRR